MEWNRDPLWWDDGVKVQVVHGNRAKGVAEAPGKLDTVPAGPALHAAGRRSSTPSSPASSCSQGIRHSKKYSTEPPKQRQPWFEFLVSWLQQHTARLPPVAISNSHCLMTASSSCFELLEVYNLHAHLPAVIESCKLEAASSGWR